MNKYKHSWTNNKCNICNCTKEHIMIKKNGYYTGHTFYFKNDAKFKMIPECLLITVDLKKLPDKSFHKTLTDLELQAVNKYFRISDQSEPYDREDLPEPDYMKNIYKIIDQKVKN